MTDLIYIGIIVAFFLIALAYIAACDVERRRKMSIETTLALICSVLLMGYLIFALLKPEKF